MILFSCHPCGALDGFAPNHQIAEVPRNHAIIAILLGETVDRGANVPELFGSFGVFPQTVAADSNVEQLDMFRPARC